MARAGTFSSLGTTVTAYFRSNNDFNRNLPAPAASSGIGTSGDGTDVKGFRVRSDSANTTNVLMYVNSVLVDTIPPGGVGEFVTITAGSFAAKGVRLELAAASGTVSGTFGLIGD